VIMLVSMTTLMMMMMMMMMSGRFYCYRPSSYRKMIDQVIFQMNQVRLFASNILINRVSTITLYKTSHHHHHRHLLPRCCLISISSV
jgi:hypothetical protein